VLPDGRVLDSEPMAEGKGLLVFDKASGSWMNFDGTFGEWRRSKPLTDAEAAALCRSSDPAP
jgi:hypothetical protein